jgi:hypothetical protein
MADYTLNNAWSDIDAVTSAYKSGALIKKTSLPARSERDVLPVSAKPDGSLWARSAMVYSFSNENAYEAFRATYPDAMKDGDQVWIRFNVSGREYTTMYIYMGGNLNEAVTIYSSVINDNQNGTYPPASGIPIEDLSDEIKSELKKQIVYGFRSKTAYENFVNKDYPGVIRSGDIIWITEEDGSNMYQMVGSTLNFVYSVPIEPHQFVVQITTNGTGYKCDKTPAQIYAAYNEGKTVVAKDSLGRLYHPYRITSTFVSFTAVGEYEGDDEIFLLAYIVKSDGTVRVLSK